MGYLVTSVHWYYRRIQARNHHCPIRQEWDESRLTAVFTPVDLRSNLLKIDIWKLREYGYECCQIWQKFCDAMKKADMWGKSVHCCSSLVNSETIWLRPGELKFEGKKKKEKKSTYLAEILTEEPYRACKGKYSHFFGVLLLTFWGQFKSSFGVRLTVFRGGSRGPL